VSEAKLTDVMYCGDLCELGPGLSGDEYVDFILLVTVVFSDFASRWPSVVIHFHALIVISTLAPESV